MSARCDGGRGQEQGKERGGEGAGTHRADSRALRHLAAGAGRVVRIGEAKAAVSHFAKLVRCVADRPLRWLGPRLVHDDGDRYRVAKIEREHRLAHPSGTTAGGGVGVATIVGGSPVAVIVG